MQRTAQAIIDLGALEHNFNIARQFAGNSKLMCVIKANAYGHGMLPVADRLHAGDGFAVACVDEALALRWHGIEKPVTVFQGFHNERELQLCAAKKFWPVVHHEKQLRLLASFQTGMPITVWLKISTGMNRLGFAPGKAKSLWRRMKALKAVGEVKLMTHMARADEGAQGELQISNDFTRRQIESFTASTKGLQAERSLANSAALVDWPASRGEWVRPGIMLYGASPFLPGCGSDLNLKPVMKLTSRVIALNTHRQGDPVGYGGTWVCPHDMTVAVVAIGYGDGYPRGVVAGTPVLIRGRRAVIVGRVSMDLLTVDLQGIDAKVGDEVVLWGPGLSVDEIARHANTISYELLCNVSNRVHYEYR
jgi:alanine racemase